MQYLKKNQCNESNIRISSKYTHMVRMGEWGSDVQGTRERCNLIFKQYQHYC